jgi:hypothetical protein
MSHRPCHSRSWAGGHGLKASWRTWGRAMEVLKVAEASNRRDALIGGLFVWQPGRQGCHGGRPPSATRGSQLACNDKQLGWPGDHSISCNPAQPESSKNTRLPSPCADAIRNTAHGSVALSQSRGRPVSRSQAKDHLHPFRQAISRLGEPHDAQVPHSPPLETAWLPSPAFWTWSRWPVARGPRRSVHPSW